MKKPVRIRGACFAKPKLNSNVGMKEFSDAKLAALYLEEVTGYNMSVLDWQMIGKIVKKEKEDA